MSKYKVNFSRKAYKQLRKIDNKEALRITNWLEDNIETGSPRRFGKVLKGEHKDKWRYRVGKYRLICEIYDDQLLVLVVKIGTRGDVYK